LQLFTRQEDIAIEHRELPESGLLGSEEEKKLVLDDRPAYRTAKLVALSGRDRRYQAAVGFAARGIAIETIGGQVLVLQVFVQIAVKPVGTAFGLHQHHAPRAAPKLRRITIGDDL